MKMISNSWLFWRIWPFQWQWSNILKTCSKMILCPCFPICKISFTLGGHPKISTCSCVIAPVITLYKERIVMRTGYRNTLTLQSSLFNTFTQVFINFGPHTHPEIIRDFPAKAFIWYKGLAGFGRQTGCGLPLNWRKARKVARYWEVRHQSC